MLFNRMKRIAALCASAIAAASVVLFPMKTEAISSYMPFPIALQQNEESGAEIQRNSYLPEFDNWCDYPWNRGTEKNNTVGKAACSLFSVINNVYYHTGKIIAPTVLAQYALDKGYRRVGYDGVVLDFFPAFVQNFGSEYGMGYHGWTTSAENALAHVRNGGSTSSNIYGHWITIVDYDAESDLYLILDSAQACARCENITWTDRENGIAWLSSSELLQKAKSGNYGLSGVVNMLFSFDYTFTAQMGDANGSGEIDMSDATIILSQYAYDIAGLESFPYHPHPSQNELCAMAADVDGDSCISIDDATIVLQMYADRMAGIDY